jgi:hypothetical protein
LEKSLKLLRLIQQPSLKLHQIVEKGFFIDSRTSLPLQLCDLCAHTLKKREEAKAGLRENPLDSEVIRRLEPLLHKGTEAFQDIVAWITAEEKKKRPGA